MRRYLLPSVPTEAESPISGSNRLEGTIGNQVPPLLLVVGVVTSVGVSGMDLSDDIVIRKAGWSWAWKYQRSQNSFNPPSAGFLR